MAFTAALLITLGLLFSYMGERFERSAHPPPGKLPERKPPTRDTIGKVTYDPVADEVLRRMNERRRKSNIDNGMRRRKEDRS